MVGKRIRLARIFGFDGRAVLIALDHGQFMGPLPGLVDMRSLLEAAVLGKADGVILNPGAAEQFVDTYAGRLSLILRVTGAMTYRAPKFDYHRQISTIEEAIALGADAVIAMGLVGGEGEPESLSLIARLAGECRRMGMPLIAEMVPSDPTLTYSSELIRLAARVGAELGADVIKTYFTGAPYFKEIARCCPVPILVAGGPKSESALNLAEQAVAAGAAGVAFGRNVFEHENPYVQVRRLVEIVHKQGGEGSE